MDLKHEIIETVGDVAEQKAGAGGLCPAQLLQRSHHTAPKPQGHWLQLCSLPCWAARLLSTCTCSLRTQPSLPGDAWLSDSIPKDHLVQMPWDASFSFPRLISRASHIASCPLCTSLTTFLHPTLLLSSSHDPSLSPFGQHGQNGPVPQCGLTSIATPRHLCLYDKGASHIYSRGLLMG